MKGVTLIELLLVIAIVLVVVGGGAPVVGRWQQSQQLNDTVVQMGQWLKTARERSLAGLNDATHGVYLEINDPGADRVILYQGASFVTRNSAYDRAVTLDVALSLSSTLAGNEVNFVRVTGKPNATGTITVSHSVSDSRTITINSSGLVDTE